MADFIKKIIDLISISATAYIFVSLFAVAWIDGLNDKPDWSHIPPFVIGFMVAGALLLPSVIWIAIRHDKIMGVNRIIYFVTPPRNRLLMSLAYAAAVIINKAVSDHLHAR